MIDFIYSEKFLVIIGISLFVNAIIFIFTGFWIGRYQNIKRMDMMFQGYSNDYGTYFNMYRAGMYGLAMIFPNTVGKRLFKTVDFKAIDWNTKWPFLLFNYLIFIGLILMVIWVILDGANINP